MATARARTPKPRKRRKPKPTAEQSVELRGPQERPGLLAISCEQPILPSKRLAGPQDISSRPRAGDPPPDDPPKALAEFRQWLSGWIDWWCSERMRGLLQEYGIVDGPEIERYAKSAREAIRVATALDIAPTKYVTVALVPDKITRKELLEVYSDLVKQSDAVLTVRLPLGEKAALLYEKLISLPEHRGMTGPKILDWFSDEHGEIVDHGTLAKEIIPALKPYGLRPARRIGYFIPPKDRPRKIPS